MEVGGYIADPWHRPDGIAKQKPPTVGSLNALCQLQNADVRDQRCPKNSIVFLEQNSGKHIKGLRRQIAKRPELTRVVMRRQASSLDLISHFCGIRGVSIAHRVRRLLPTEGATKQMLSKIADGIIRTSDDAAPSEFLRYRSVQHEQLRRS